jgi:O-antigen ligase
MPSQHLTSEYEPVTPLRGAKPSAAGVRDDDDERGPREGDVRSIDFDDGGARHATTAVHEESAARRAGSKREKKPWLERWGTRRGHLAGFAGLFLFTFILYFRPYEQVSFLASFTSMAFWTATLTLALYFPAQLSLEGNLTARPREVNLLLLFALTALLSIPLALNRGEAWDTFVEPFGKAALMFLVIVNTVRTLRRLRWMLMLGVVVGCYLSVGAIVDYRHGLNTVEGYRVAGSIGNLFGNPNDMAIHLVTMIPVVVAFLFGARGLKKALYAACLFLLVAGLMLTFSRGGTLALGGMAFVLAWKLGRRNRFAVMALLFVAIVLMAALAPGGFGLRMLSIFDSSLDPVGSSSARRELLILSVITALKHPLFGVGMNNFHIVSIREAVTHNSYTQVAAEMGMTALALYTMFIVTPLRRLARIERATLSARRASNFYYLSVGLQASLVAYMISSFFGAIAYSWYVYYLVGYAVALRRIYATTGEVETEDANVKTEGAEARRGSSGAETSEASFDARTEVEDSKESARVEDIPAGFVIYDARSAHVLNA